MTPFSADELQTAFEQINIAQRVIRAETRELYAKRKEIDNEISNLIAPHAEIIDAMKADIKAAVLEGEASAKTAYGVCTFVKGRKAVPKWDDAALHGYGVVQKIMDTFEGDCVYIGVGDSGEEMDDIRECIVEAREA